MSLFSQKQAHLHLKLAEPLSNNDPISISFRIHFLKSIKAHPPEEIIVLTSIYSLVINQHPLINNISLLYMDHPVTLEEERKVWTIHQSVNGTTYYYNRATKKSQYEMPECFKTTQEVLEHPDWKEYRTAEGKKFYYNAITRKSCWQLPNEVKEYRLKLQQKRRKDREEGRLQQEEVLSEAEEIKRKLMSLFKQKLIGVNTKWDACIKLCEDDDRWQLLKISDKKKYYLEYVAELKKVSDQEKKAKTEINKIQFLKMLRENKTLNSDCKMHKMAYDFMADPRWRLLDEHERENTYQNYMDQLYQKEKEEINRQKRENCQRFREQLQKDEVKYNSKWDDIRVQYKDNENFKALHPYDRISTFLEYIFDAEKKEEEEQNKEKRLRERKNRISFREFLRDKIANGELGYKSRWKEFITDFRNEKSLLAMMDPSQPGTSAHEIFQIFMEEVREKHKLIKGLIKHHFKKQNFKMTEETSKEEFLQNLTDMPEYIQLPGHLQSYFHKYFLMKIKSKKQSKQASAKKSSKKERKIIFKIFQHLQTKGQLKNKYSIENQMEYIEKNMKTCGATVTPETIFKYYLAFLESSEQEHSRKRSKSNKSSVSSDDHKKHKRKHKIQQIQDQDEAASALRKFNIPELTELKMQQMNDAQQEGEIKDESGEQQPNKRKNKSKKKKKSSSSDSD